LFNHTFLEDSVCSVSAALLLIKSRFCTKSK